MCWPCSRNWSAWVRRPWRRRRRRRRRSTDPGCRGREGGATREDTRKLPVTMTGKRAEGVHHPAGGFFGFDYSRYHNRREECENPAHAVQSTLPQKVLTYYAICPDDCLGVRSCDGAVTSRRSSTSAAIFMGDAGMGKLLFHGNLVTVPVTFR